MKHTKSRKFRPRPSKTSWVAMGALVASTTLAVRLDAVHNPRLTALRFVVPSETLAGAWRDDTPAARQDPPVRRFDIPAAPLDVVLERFRVVTGLRVRVADPAIGTLQSPGVAGLFTAEQALKQLLTGTASASASPTPMR